MAEIKEIITGLLEDWDPDKAYKELQKWVTNERLRKYREMAHQALRDADDLAPHRCVEPDAPVVPANLGGVKGVLVTVKLFFRTYDE